MAAWLKRRSVSLLLDALVVAALAVPAVGEFLRWPLFVLYIDLSFGLFRTLRSDLPWIKRVFQDPATRIAHGLEHATIAVLSAEGMPVIHGAAHGRDRFFIAMEAECGCTPEAVREAASSAIRRILDGERSLAYHPGCGTSRAVSAVTMWSVYATSLLVTLVTRGAAPVFLAVSVLVFRIWLACDTALGLVAQRLFTVSTDFTSGHVVDARVMPGTTWAATLIREGEVGFEVVVDIQLAATRGGLVSPGVLV